MIKQFVVFILFFVVSFGGISQVKKLLIIGVDGCRPDALMAANTPNIDRLMENAVYSLDAINEGTTLSGPSWSAMLTGVWEDKHGVTDNSFEGQNFNEYPSFFKFIEDYNSTLNTFSISQWGPINDNISLPFVDVVKSVMNEEELIDETVNCLVNQDPDVLFIQFDDVDHAGHSYGFSPEVDYYIEAIEEVDVGIGKILEALESRPTYSGEDWLIIVAPDHGGIGKSHGGNSIEERNIFIICSGANVLPKVVEKDSVLTMVFPPENCLEDSVELIFDGHSKVTTAFNSAFNFGANQDFSVECRVRTTNPADVAIIANKNWESGKNKGFVFSFKIGSNRWKVNIGDGINRADVVGNAINDNKWHTLSATFDRDGYLTIFEDGQLVDSVSIVQIENIHSGFPISFGADALGVYSYSGSIAEVRIFNKVLPKETISLWNCKKIDSSYPELDALIGYWRLAEGGESNVVYDLSANHADGEVSIAKWQNTSDATNIWAYDYSNTPRTVDVAVTALAHFGISVKKEWDLDGEVFGMSEVNTAVSERRTGAVKVFPNPAKTYVVFRLVDSFRNNARLAIYNNLGILIDSFTVQSAEFVYECGELAGGFYFYRLMTEENEVSVGRFVVCSE